MENHPQNPDLKSKDAAQNRKTKEKEHANYLRHAGLKSSVDYEKMTANKKFYSIERKSVSLVNKWLEDNSKGKRFLDYCCGDGQVALKMSTLGVNEAVGIDISDISIENAKRNIPKDSGDKKLQYYVMDAEKMTFPNNSFDVAIAGGVLHHLDLSLAYQEIARVLKPTGKCICHETLGHNKLIQLYRKRTPHLRTEWEIEHIIRKKDIELAKKYFQEVEILGFFHLVTILAVPLRNWTKFNFILSILERLDTVLLNLPFLKWQAWQVVYVLSKPKSNQP